MRIVDDAQVRARLELVWRHVAVAESRRRHGRGELAIQCIVVEIETFKLCELVDLAGYRACDGIVSKVAKTCLGQYPNAITYRTHASLTASLH